MSNYGFVATLSNGTVAAENNGMWTVIPGERKPWVRLQQYCADNDLHITSLRLNVDGQTYHLPKIDTRFNTGALHPDSYSIQYIGEVEQDGTTNNLIDVGAYYGDVSVHLMCELDGQHTSWTQVRQDFKPLCKVGGK